MVKRKELREALCDVIDRESSKINKLGFYPRDENLNSMKEDIKVSFDRIYAFTTKTPFTACLYYLGKRGGKNNYICDVEFFIENKVKFLSGFYNNGRMAYIIAKSNNFES